MTFWSGVNLTALFVSVRIAVVSTLFCLIVGVPLAAILSSRRLRARSLFEGIVTLPLVLPPTALGYFFLISMGVRSPIGRVYHQITGSNLVFSWQGVAVAVSTVSLPLMVRTVQTAFQLVDHRILEAARLDGASAISCLWRIQLPVSIRAIAAGTSLAFARSLGDFGVALMVGGNIPGPDGTHTMSLAVYDSVNLGDDHTALMLVLVLSVIAFLFAVSASKFGSMRAN